MKDNMTLETAGTITAFAIGLIIAYLLGYRAGKQTLLGE